MTESEVLNKYSTPGLRKSELTRAAKKDHLNGLKTTREDRDKILDQLYGPEAPHALAETDRPLASPPLQQGPA